MSQFDQLRPSLAAVIGLSGDCGRRITWSGCSKPASVFWIPAGGCRTAPLNHISMSSALWEILQTSCIQSSSAIMNAPGAGDYQSLK